MATEKLDFTPLYHTDCDYPIMSDSSPLSSENPALGSASSYQRMEESAPSNTTGRSQQHQPAQTVSTPASNGPSNFQPKELHHHDEHAGSNRPQQSRINNQLESHTNEYSSTTNTQNNTNPDWFTKNTRTHRAQAAAAAAQEAAAKLGAVGYQGGRMSTDRRKYSPAAVAALNTNDPNAPHPSSSSASDFTSESYEPPPQQVERLMRPDIPYGQPHPFKRISSWMTASSVGTLEDFDDSEWTPKDSSYGAAIPIAGWIPKNIRRLIEYSLMTVVAALFIYLVVAITIKIREQNDGLSSNKDSFYLDDDMYVPYDDVTNTTQVAADDDDGSANNNYSYNNNNYNNRRLRYTSWSSSDLQEDDDRRHDGGENDDWISFSQQWDDTDDVYLP